MKTPSTTREQTTMVLTLTALCGLAASTLSGCGGFGVRGAQTASVEPRGEVADLAQGDTDHSPASATPAAPGFKQPAKSTARGNPMPNWVIVEAERVIANGGGALTALPTGAAIATPEIATRSTASEEAATLMDGMDGLARMSFAEEGADFDPRVSRDGKSLVFASTQHRPTADIYIKQIGSRTVTQLTADPANDIMPSIAPDGKKIAFASDRTGSWKIFVMSSQGGQAVQMTFDASHDLHPSWSPDAKRLVFCRLGQMSGRWEMWVLDTDRPSSAEFLGYGMFPEWSPVAATGTNGTDKILFQRGRERGDRAFSLWTIDYKPGSASALTEIISAKGFAAINPSWSPDGQWIAYGLTPASTTARGATKSDLWIASINGAGRVNVSAGRYNNVMPTWGSDSRLYFVSDRGGLDNIWSVATDKALAAASASMQNSATASAQLSAPSAAPKAGDVAPSNTQGEPGLATVPTP